MQPTRAGIQGLVGEKAAYDITKSSPGFDELQKIMEMLAPQRVLPEAKPEQAAVVPSMSANVVVLGEQPVAPPMEDAAAGDGSSHEPASLQREAVRQSPVPDIPRVPEKTEAEWVDETGVRFTRELTPHEQAIKIVIDTSARLALERQADVALRDPRYATEDPSKFKSDFVERGLNHTVMITARIRKYTEGNLPVKKDN